MQRITSRTLPLALFLVAVLLGSVLTGALSAQPVGEKSKVTAYAGDLNVDRTDAEDDSGFGGWMPETESEHPIHHCEAVKGVPVPILLHGAAWHVYHDFSHSRSQPPSTPPPDLA